MSKLIKIGDLKNPYIIFDSTMGTMELSGRSTPENALEVYSDLLSQIDKYVLKPQKKTFVNIFLEYYNSSSSKCLVQILEKLNSLEKEGTSKIILNWFIDSEDENMLEEIEVFESIVSFKFNYIEIDF